MDKLDFYSLSMIFKNLDLLDLNNCSQVCQKWKETSYLNYLFICYGKKFIPLKQKCLHQPLLPDQKINLIPHEIFDNSLYEFLKTDFFKNIQTFIFFGNCYFEPPNSFNFRMLPNLKYVEIMNHHFCNYINENFKSYIADKKLKSEIWKYSSSSIETLILQHIDFSILLSNYPNLKYISINELRKSIDFKLFLNQLETNNWKSFILRSDNFIIKDENIHKYIIKFLMNKCPNLEAISIKLNSKEHLDEILSNRQLKNICVKIYKGAFATPVEYYKEIISMYKERIEKECCLCIDNILIRNLDDFEILTEKLRNFKSIKKDNEASFEINVKLKILKIFNPFDFKNLKNFSNIDSVKRVVITYSSNDEKMYNELYSILPNSVIDLTVESEFPISSAIFNIIGKNLPYLEKLCLDSPKTNINEFKFVLIFKYLNTLKLLVSNIEIKNLIKEVKNVFYLNHIFFCHILSYNDINDLIKGGFEIETVSYSLCLLSKERVYDDESQVFYMKRKFLINLQRHLN